MKSTYIDRSGQRFSRLVAVSRGPDHQWPNCKPTTTWNCLCDCGKMVVVLSAQLTSGMTKSCGCLNSERAIERNTTHGMNRSPTHHSWTSMIQRCNNPKNTNYHRYGARGISVCERWRKFENFLADMGVRPPKTTLDRHPNNDGNYEPGNCRWAMQQEQDNNKRNTVYIEIQGREIPLAEACKMLSISYETMKWRLSKGKTGDDLVKPPNEKMRRAASCRWSTSATPPQS